MKNKRRQKGSIGIEVAVSIALFAVIAASSLMLIQSMGRLNHHLWKRHTCFAAGQAQMDAIRITGRAIEEEQFQSLWPNVECEIRKSQGKGQWSGMEKIELVLSSKDEGSKVEISLVSFIPSNERHSHETK